MVQAVQEVKTCPPDHKHGETGTCYTGHGCRCGGCRERQRDRKFYWHHMKGRGLPEQRIPARGLHRRVQAMIALGYARTWIERELGLSHSQVAQWLESETVLRRTYDRLVPLYERVKFTPRVGLTTGEKVSVTRARLEAQRNGYLPPAAWDDIDHDPAPPTHDESYIRFDHAVVELAVMGHKPTLTTDEREEVVRRLHSRRWSDATIAAHIGGFGETVLRTRQRLGLAAWPKGDLLWHEKDAA